MKFRVPQPAVLLKDAQAQLAPLLDGTGRPSAHSLPNFHYNVFVRLLAAKPKLDVITRRHYPSTLLNKVGFTANQQFGAISRDSRNRGPRIWVSSSPSVKNAPPLGSSLLRRPTLPTPLVKNEPTWRAKAVLLEDLKRHLDHYLAGSVPEPRHLVMKVSTMEPTNTSVLPLEINIANIPELIDLGIPSEIDNRRSGLHLSGDIYKYVYIYGPLRQSSTRPEVGN